MPKRIYGPNEPCDKCQTPTVPGKNGYYCKVCYIAWKNAQNAMQPAQGGYAPNSVINTPQRNSVPYKANPVIERAVAHKDDSIKMAGSARDAVLLTTTFYPELALDGNDLAKEELIQEKIKEWRTWLLDNIYNVPF